MTGLTARRAALRPPRRLARIYADLWRDILHLCATGHLRTRELD